MIDKYKNIIIEANRYPTVSNKFKNALDRLPEKYFNRKGVKALIKKLKEKDPEAAMAYTMDAFGWMKGMKEGKLNEASMMSANDILKKMKDDDFQAFLRGHTSKEDRFWAIKIVENGLSYYYEPKLQCYHHWTNNGAAWNGIG